MRILEEDPHKIRYLHVAGTGVLTQNANTGHMTKCTMCHSRIENGEAPACVDACPTQALQWGSFEDVDAIEGAVDQFDILPDPTITKPASRPLSSAAA